MLLFFAVESQAAQNIKIEIPETIYNTEYTFRLGEVAKITGGNSSTRKILQGVQVFTDGDRLSRSEVLRAINESDASDARIELYMPQYSRVDTPGYEGNFTESSQEPERNASSLAPVIKSLASWTGDVEVSAASPVPDGKLIDPASIVPGTPAATLRFKDDSGRIRSLGVRLNWTQNVMIAAHNLRKDVRINSAIDVVSRPMKITRPGMYASTPQEVDGFKPNKAIKQGEPILLSNLTSSSVIKKGRAIKVIARYAGASATIDGVLLEDGKPGDWVKIRKADDKRVTLRAKIINENMAEVQVE